MYMQNFKCHVTGATSTKRLATARPAVFCADDQTKCQGGAKQMIAWNRQCSVPRKFEIRSNIIAEAEGNNIQVPAGVAPGYNSKMGFAPGAQNDIFE